MDTILQGVKKKSTYETTRGFTWGFSPTNFIKLQGILRVYQVEVSDVQEKETTPFTVGRRVFL